jgi:hypothetical protein
MSEPDPDTLGVAVAKRRLEGFSNESAPGWYALGTNPNEQSYWDGEGFTGVRHWIAGRGWIEDDQAHQPSAPAPGLEPSGVFRAQQQAVNFGRRATDHPSFTIGVLLLMACGVALMYGSLGAWISETAAFGAGSLHANVTGTDPAISTLIGCNGWVTFVGGVVLLVFGGLSISSNDAVLARITLLISTITLIFAVYDMFRMVQKIHGQTGVSIGWGLICVLSAAILAMLISLTRFLKAR